MSGPQGGGVNHRVLAALLHDARFVRVPGDHGSAFAAPELTAAIAAFLTER